MKLIVLNGPTGTGKNTIAALLSKKREKCVVIDFDVLRNMFVQPHKAPWEGEVGVAQQLLGVHHACLLAKSFIEQNYDVIILMFYPMRPHYFILLLPSFEEIKRRNSTRPGRLTDQELEMVYSGQTKLKVFDEKIDNSNLSAQQVAEHINNNWTN